MIEALLLVVLAGLVGSLMGSFTGIVPGIHANTLAIMMLTGVVFCEGALEPLVGAHIETRLLLAVLVAATSMAHTFANFIPGTFLGAPESDTALSVLPMHDMLLRGHGYRAIVLSAMGSLWAVLFLLAALLPFRWLMGPPLNGYDLMREYMFWLLLGVTVLLLATERAEIPYRKLALGDGKVRVEGPWSRPLGIALAAGVFLLAGAFGWVVLQLETTSPLGLPSTALFPTFTGLFGLATLLFSRANLPEIPSQDLDDVESPPGTVASAATGSAAGAVVGFLPGVTPGIGTILAMQFRQWGARLRGRERDDAADSEQVIVTLGAVNTAAALIILAALFVILRPRNGTAIVISQLVIIEPWTNTLPPESLTYLLVGVVIATAIGYHLTCRVGRVFARHFMKLNYPRLVLGIIITLVLLVAAFTGPLGLLILATATAIGYLPPTFGLRRSHAMGVLLLPVMLVFAPF